MTQYITLTEIQRAALVERNGLYYLEFTFPHQLNVFELARDEKGFYPTNIWAHTFAELIQMGVI